MTRTVYFHCLCAAGLGSEDEVRLVETLFQKQGYNPLIRPVRNLNETITVKFGLAMIQLINVVSAMNIIYEKSCMA
jgi:hypothetical protein